MKKLSILLAAVLAFSFAGCMDHHDDPTGYTYGNPAVGEANTTIAQLKETYRSAIQSSSTPALVETPTIIEGVVVALDPVVPVRHSLYRHLADQAILPQPIEVVVYRGQHNRGIGSTKHVKNFLSRHMTVRGTHNL